MPDKNQIPVQTRRTVDIYEYIPVLQEILAQGKDVNLLVSGCSMNPFLGHLRDTVIISPVPEDRKYKRGDIVFYTRPTGQYVLHRVHHVDEKGRLYIVGDAQDLIEGPVDPNAVFGIVRSCIRKGKVQKKGCFWWDFFEKFWIRIVPARRFIMKCYNLFRRKNG